MKTALGTVALPVAFPSIVPASVFGTNAPSNRINIGAIGMGRISISYDMPSVLGLESARVVAACDVDQKRAEGGKKFINDHYSKKENKPYDGVKVFTDYRELLSHKDIDAVVISTPDHWHGLLTIHAARAGKDIYLQKPASLTIAEGREVSDAVKKAGVILQMGSQQRSLYPWPQFHKVCELVRNGRIGKLEKIFIGLPGDPAGGDSTQMDVPAHLNYDMWLGETPEVYYTQDRVHSQSDVFARPGWLRCEQFGAGMITGWGSHHIDIAHWGMGTEYSGPVEVWGSAAFAKAGLWDVHGKFTTYAKYENGVLMEVSDGLPNGVKFEGTDGWIFVTRGNYSVTSSDPVQKDKADAPLMASDPAILTSVIGDNEVRLYRAPEQHEDWINCIKSRQQPVAPVEVGHRSCSACLLHHAAMKLNRKLYWDPVKERFRNDDEANNLLQRTRRSPYVI